MPSVYNFSETEMLSFFLVLLRLSAFLVAWPVLGGAIVPKSIKILFSLSLALLVFPAVDQSTLTVDINSMQIIWLFIREAFIGVSLGMLIHFYFAIFNIAGDAISVSMGLSQAQLFNPALGGKLSAFEQLLVILATLFFLSVGGHHLFLTGIVDSFRVIPLGAETLNLGGFSQLGVFIQGVMLTGIQIASPVILAVLFMNLSMAIIGKAVPQINVLVTSLPINVLVGFFILIFSLPLIVWQMDTILQETAEKIFTILRTY